LRTAARPLLALLVFFIAAPAFAVDEIDLARRQADQRRARAMTREMVSAVLELQLRQLEENGLTDLPLYSDIRAMRGNLAALVDGEMAAVVGGLVEAQQATGADRDVKFVEARRAIREVVVRLSVERQALLRRLKAAEIVEQTRRLIELQDATREATAALPGLPDDRRPEAALRAVEDQRDVKGLFLRLADTLDDVKPWDGPIATAASGGLRSLKGAYAERRLDQAEASLNAAAFGEATGHQDAVLDALRKLLAVIEQAEGRIDRDSGDLVETARQILERQQAILEQVKREGVTEPAPETVESQQRVAADLADLADELARNATAEPLRRQAETAARAAAEALFAADEDRTLTEQQRTIDRLTALVAALETGTSGDRRDRSAEELAQLAERLQAARNELQQAIPKHSQAEQATTADPQAASQAERAAAEQAAKIAAREGLPPSVAARLADAADAARAAADRLTTGNNAAASTAVAEAGDAFQRAQAAVEEALADAQRAEAAVRVGELARAAEALERAAAAERQVATEASRAAEASGLSAEQTAAMKRVQEDVTVVATKTAEGVRAAAPEAAETLSRALAASKRTDEALSQAAASPGERSKPTAGTAAEQAGQTAAALSQAAATLRSKIGENATRLAGLTGEQLKPVATAQEAVTQATEALGDGSQPAIKAASRAAEASANAETGATAASQAAERALTQPNSVTDASDALDRAAISLAAREQQLQRDRQLAERLAQLATRQQTAVEQIEQARQSLADSPSDPAAMSPQQRQAAESLHAATRQFAGAQRATGQGAVQVSGQQQVANVPIREALEAAERLPVPQLPGRPSQEGSQIAQGEGTQQPPAQGQPSESAEQPAEDAIPPGDNAQAQSGQGTPSDSPGSPGGPQATGLGSGLVPAAPGETARMIAGPDAQATLAALDALQGIESMEDVAASDTELLAEGEMPPNAEANPEDARNPPANGEPSPDGEGTQTPDATGRDADPGVGPADAAWFAKLPPEVRAAIRASSSQPAPKAYEGRLRRYFESVDE
jgi:hypothetical protein